MTVITDTATDIEASGKSMSFLATVNNMTIEAERDNVIITSKNDVDLNSTANSINLDAKHCINIVTDQKSVNIKSFHGKVNVLADNSIKMRSTNGTVMVKSDRSDLNLESYEDMEVLAEQGDITITATNGVVNIKAMNGISIVPGNNGSVHVDGALHATSISQGRTGDNGLLMPTATVVPYCGTTGPTGWFLCDGSSYNKITYNDLFLVIGYTFGGSGNNFNVPDMRGRLPLGISNGISEISNKTMGNTGGSETHTLTTDEMPAHTHTVDTDISGWESSAYSVSGAPDRPNRGSNIVTTSSAGSGGAHSIMQPYMALNFIIKY